MKNLLVALLLGAAATAVTSPLIRPFRSADASFIPANLNNTDVCYGDLRIFNHSVLDTNVSGLVYNATGCMLPAQQHVNISGCDLPVMYVGVKNVPVGLAFRGNTVGNGTALILNGPDIGKANMMMAWHVEIVGNTFQRDSQLRILGSIPINSTIVIKENTFEVRGPNAFFTDALDTIYALTIGSLPPMATTTRAPTTTRALTTTTPTTTVFVNNSNVTTTTIAPTTTDVNATTTSAPNATTTAPLNTTTTPPEPYVKPYEPVSIYPNAFIDISENTFDVVAPNYYPAAAIGQLSDVYFTDHSSLTISKNTVNLQCSHPAGGYTDCAGMRVLGYVQAVDGTDGAHAHVDDNTWNIRNSNGVNALRVWSPNATFQATCSRNRISMVRQGAQTDEHAIAVGINVMGRETSVQIAENVITSIGNAMIFFTGAQDITHDSVLNCSWNDIFSTSGDPGVYFIDQLSVIDRATVAIDFNRLKRQDQGLVTRPYLSITFDINVLNFAYFSFRDNECWPANTAQGPLMVTLTGTRVAVIDPTAFFAVCNNIYHGNPADLMVDSVISANLRSRLRCDSRITTTSTTIATTTPLPTTTTVPTTTIPDNGAAPSGAAVAAVVTLVAAMCAVLML